MEMRKCFGCGFLVWAVLNCFWVVEAQTPSPSPTNLVILQGESNLLMVFREVVLRLTPVPRGNKEIESTTFKSATAKTAVAVNETVTNVTLTFPNADGPVKTSKFEVMMSFRKDRLGYWSLQYMSVDLKGTEGASGTFDYSSARLSSPIAVTVPVGQSFHCTRFGSLYPNMKAEELKQDYTFQIDFKGFQMQIYGPEGRRFADAYECVGFFTPGIWTGIFVTIILMSILTWGLKMIMDVKTMDRFDDPKGKQISFGSGSD